MHNNYRFGVLVAIIAFYLLSGVTEAQETTTKPNNGIFSDLLSGIYFVYNGIVQIVKGGIQSVRGLVEVPFKLVGLLFLKQQPNN
ncbi:hypothetical protein C0J52_10291 [Blattella germanica]|nr:hypothetical protein C0J52_10291 [Blattella germanica]